MNKSQGRIIHRSKYRLITDDLEAYNRKRQKEKADSKIQGWNTPHDKPYRPFGKFSNVLFVLDAVKKSIPHSKRLGYSTEKSLKSIKRSNNPTIYGEKPRRTLKILNENMSDSEEEGEHAQRKRIERKLAKISRNAKLAHNMSADRAKSNREAGAKIVNKINTSNYVILSSLKDGSDALKNELTMSYNRMRASRNGHDLSNSLERLNHGYYTTNKNRYLIQNKASLKKIMKENSGTAVRVLEQTPVMCKFIHR